MSTSVDFRTRRHCDRVALDRDAIFDTLIPEALEKNGALAGRGVAYKKLPALSLQVEDRRLDLAVENERLVLSESPPAHRALASLDESALSDLVQDWSTTMGLAMKTRVKIVEGDFNEWIGWEPVFRALFDARPVHEAGAIGFDQIDGSPLNIEQSFSIDDANDRPDEIAHFLSQAGYLHIRNVFTEDEMASVSADLDAALARARADDGASWWAEDSKGNEQAVRILYFQEQSAALRTLLADKRLQWLGSLTGDPFKSEKTGTHQQAEGLVKPLDIQTGLSDLPWHKDCGQGGHSYLCNSLTVGISVTGADSESGALGIVPGSHRANVQTAGKDESLDMPALKLETRTGDLTIHCSDTLHRAHRPTKRPRKVVYTGFRLGLKPGDAVEEVSKEQVRAERARLTNVQDRIATAGAGAGKSEFVALEDADR
ncbi:MAG: phytanoyl-CoA dioxygenase family protein [Myxococcota bacterium]